MFIVELLGYLLIFNWFLSLWRWFKYHWSINWILDFNVVNCNGTLSSLAVWFSLFLSNCVDPIWMPTIQYIKKKNLQASLWIANSYAKHHFDWSAWIGWISQREVIWNNQGPDALHWAVCQFQSCNYFHSWWYVLMFVSFFLLSYNIYTYAHLLYQTSTSTFHMIWKHSTAVLNKVTII